MSPDPKDAYAIDCNSTEVREALLKSLLDDFDYASSELDKFMQPACSIPGLSGTFASSSCRGSFAPTADVPKCGHTVMLRYAFFPDFHSGPKLLLWGDNVDMRALSAFLRQMAPAPREVDLSEVGFCSAAGDTNRDASKEESRRRDESAGGRESVSLGGRCFECRTVRGIRLIDLRNHRAGATSTWNTCDPVQTSAPWPRVANTRGPHRP
jgi:hypothetical protein